MMDLATAVFAAIALLAAAGRLAGRRTRRAAVLAAAGRETAAPSGPAGLGFMPVIVGLGISKAAPDAEAAKQAIDFLTKPETQARVLKEMGFFPAISGVDTTNLPRGVAIQRLATSFGHPWW